MFKTNSCKHFSQHFLGWQCGKKLQPEVTYFAYDSGERLGSYTIYLQKRKRKKKEQQQQKSLWNIFWQLLQTALEECRERLNALKWVFLTFALLSHWNSTNSFFMFLTSCVNLAMGRKKSPATNSRYGKAIAVRAAAFWGGAQFWRPLEWGKKQYSSIVFSNKLDMVLSVFFKSDFSEVCVLSVVMYLSANSSLLAIMYLLALITFW